MIDFEKEIVRVSKCISTVKVVCSMNFEYYVYPKYSIQGTEILIKFNLNNKYTFCMPAKFSEQKIRQKILENIICFMRGSLDNYENFQRY